MFKKALAVTCFTLSISANAAMIDLGTITRDTATGLDWLDLTETRGRTFDAISIQLQSGGEFEGWRYATLAEVQTLWTNMGITDVFAVAVYKSDTVQFAAFVDAVGLLGNTYRAYNGAQYDYGAAGYTGDALPGYPEYRYVAGVNHEVYDGYAEIQLHGRPRNHKWDPDPRWGSYLITTSEVPLPAAGWLFMSALIGLFGKKHLSRKSLG